MSVSPSITPRLADISVEFVNHPRQLASLRVALDAAELIALDTEVPISGPGAHQLRVMSLATRTPGAPDQAFVVDCRDVAPALLAPVLTGIEAIAWNANFDARVVDEAVWESSDITPHIKWWDAQIADALLHQGRSGFVWFHGLAWATYHYLGITAEGKGTVQLSYTANDDLTPEQIRYAGDDALETLWVGAVLKEEIARVGLEEICAIELDARPLLDQMQRSGLPFDKDGWGAELEQIERENRQVLGELASLTGGGQGTLFDDVVEPSWNPGSDAQVREALNVHAQSEVMAWTSHRFGGKRLLEPSDSVTAAVLREIGGPLCDALLRYRAQTKTLSTYGASILQHLHDDGRLRPQYLQVVGTNTGRLASRNPNAQNFTPAMKPYFRPPSEDRVFVHADLSQAELRYLAQVANDGPLREAFARGDDVHIRTAASMFGFEPDELRHNDPARLKHLRQIAKALNFGIAYGSGAAALARSLTAEGSPTSVAEADQLLAQYRQTYPGTAQWAEKRVSEIRAIAERCRSIDWERSLLLMNGFAVVNDIRHTFRQTHKRWPTVDEIVDLHPRLPPPGAEEQSELDVEALRAEVNWLLRFEGPVALLPGDVTFTFTSTTLAGRQQQFNIHLDRVLLIAIIQAIVGDHSVFRSALRDFERQHGLRLFIGDHPREATDQRQRHHQIERQFENRALRRQCIEHLVRVAGAAPTYELLRKAAKERVLAMVNAWRNAPIQGGVADILLAASANLVQRLQAYPTAQAVQTVHDSIVVECDVVDAPAVADEIRDALEEASRRFCPDVTPKVDVDIRRSLADEDIIVLP